ncbi:MAG: phosphoribosylformylglycinamidine cyclo-ligase [Thermoleophilales bacterium]|nr:phosphoribosylformylglycinamidine cyclo-ligase [Thermoleophilales bacterium]
MADRYKEAGIDYGVLDAAKRLALSQAVATSPQLERRGGRAHDESRGQSAFVFDFGGQTLALVVEGLGTKAMLARQYMDETGKDFFDAMAYDTVAAIVNDLCSVGAVPLVVNAYFSTGDAAWLEGGPQFESLVGGWRRACEDAGATWGGGESPALPGLVSDHDVELAGSAVGVVPREPLLGGALEPGDEIVLVESSGLHANGASLARMLVDRHPDGVRATMPNGESFAEAVLRPSILYADLVARLIDAELPLSYLSHITGHGFLKIMRPLRPLTYRLTQVPPVPPVLEFMADQLDLDPRAAYTTLNMGAGFAVYARPGSGERVVEIARQAGLSAWVSGVVEEGPRRVVIEPIDVVLEGDEMVLGVESGD